MANKQINATMIKMKKMIQSLSSFVHSVIHWSDLDICQICRISIGRICRIVFVGFVAFVAFVGFILPSRAEAVDCSRTPGGNVTISSSCTFPATVDGADTGTGTSNTADITVSGGATLTIGAGQTISTGTLTPSGGSIAIISGGQIKIGSPLWMYDADADGYPKESTMAAQAAADPGWRRRNLMTSLTQRDCQDFYNSGYGCAPATNDLTNGTYSGAYQESAGNPALSYHELPKDNSTVGLWHMNEASGNIADSSGNSNTGTVTGTTVATGKLGNARSFNGTSDIVTISDSSSIKSPSNKLTIEAWIYPTTIAAGKTIMEKRSTGNWSSYHFDFLDNAGNLHFYTDNYGATKYAHFNASGTPVPINTWSHVAAVLDVTTGTASDVKIYVNGVAQTVSFGATSNYSTSYTIGYDTQPLYIGAWHGSSGFFPGTIDEVRISNIARTPEEIKADAQRRPYGVYTAPVNDLGQTPGSWSGMTVQAKGVRTGDGETPHSTNSLVAQWNFNETSGTTAVSGGSCGTSCNGTLTNFASTASQDQAAGTGWTAANRRWGAGALMFDGTNDYITAGDVGIGEQASFTLSAWVKTTAASQQVIYMDADSTSDVIYFRPHMRNTGVVSFNLRTAAGEQEIIGNTKVNDGNFHLVTMVRSGSNGYLYIDGKLDNSGTFSITPATNISTIGAHRTSSYPSGTQFWNGILDALSIYSRALTAAEIIANYQAGNIEFQTRTGTSQVPDGTWEAWKPTTSETQLDAMDSPSPISRISQNSLISYWTLDETSGTRADSKGTNTLTDNATVTYAPGRLSNAAQFTAANSEYLSIADNADLSTGDIDFTIAAWVNLDSKTTNRTIASKWDGTGSIEYIFYYEVANDRFDFFVNTSSSNYANSLGSPSTGVWYYIVAWHDSVANTINIQVNNGSVDSTAYSGGGVDNASPFQISKYSTGSYWDGKIDEVAFWKRTLTAAERTRLFEDGLDLHGAGSGRIYRTSDTTTKIEGTGSEKLQLGAPQCQTNVTTAIWHLEETSGTRYDACGSNNLTDTNTVTVADGFFGKAGQFTAANSEYLSIADNAALSTGDIDFSISAWVYLDSTAAYAAISKYKSSTNQREYMINFDATNKLRFFVSSNGTDYTILNSTTSISTGTWVFVAAWHDATANTINIQVNNGTVDSSAYSSGVYDGTAMFQIGGYDGASGADLWNGRIDEVMFTKRVLSAEERAEAYRAGRDHRLSKTITSTDLSAKTKLPFYIAADRPGTFMEATIGESAYANYEPDANTKGLWHLEEQTGSGAYLKDSSGTGNNATPTGSTFIQGKIGKGRSFNGTTSDYLTTPSMTLTGDVTMSAWAYHDSSQTSTGYVRTIFSIDTHERGFAIHNSIIKLTVNSGDWYYGSQASIENGWFHTAVVFTTSSAKLYVNGQLSYTLSGDYSGASGSGYIGDNGSHNGNQSWKGQIDEVIIDNTARTADEIRQAYEVGKRTHPVTIDFVTSPQAAYSTGTSVTINNPYGTTALTNTLTVGDTIIFKENVNGTETVGQAAVTAITNTSSVYGTVTVDAAPTFPTGGYTTNATVFKWQREYFDLTGSLASHVDAVTRLTWRVTDGSQGANVWLDDVRSGSYINRTTCDTLNTTTGECTYTIPSSSVTSSLNRYFQMRAIMSTWDTAVSPILTSSQVEFGL